MIENDNFPVKEMFSTSLESSDNRYNKTMAWTIISLLLIIIAVLVIFLVKS